MGTTGKQQVTPPRPTTAQQQRAPVNTKALREDTVAASKAYLRHATDRPYLKAAFANPYNLSLFLGGLVASGLTLSPFLAVMVICLEVLWLLFAPGSKLLQQALWDPQFERDRRAADEAARAARLQVLAEHDRQRVLDLIARQQEINELAAQNPSFTGELLRTELGKTDRLVESFIEMANTCSRYDAYLDSIDLSELERDRRRWEQIARKNDVRDSETEIAKKN